MCFEGETEGDTERDRERKREERERGDEGIIFISDITLIIILKLFCAIYTPIVISP